MELFYNWEFVSSIILFVIALLLQFKYNKTSWAIFSLFGAAFMVRLCFAHLDPFLHDWDERFHALVARNMMTDPFKPMLKADPVYIQDVNAWCCNHIWLHKQPLFLWQMAISMKIFGISEFAIRYPSVLIGALMVVLLYRITFLVTKQNNAAFLSAALFCYSFYHLQLISGYQGMDHNDVSFGFYVLASIWAYIEYVNKKAIHWILLVGLFAGCAILNKWLTGLVVYAGWGVNLLLTIKQEGFFKRVLHMVVSLIVCVIVFLPWQLYILNRFPELANYEYAYNSKHIFEVVEGHDGSVLFYWENWVVYYGKYIWIAVMVGVLSFFYKSKKTLSIRISLMVCFLVVFSFFSFIVKTKMQGYFFTLAPLGYIFFAALVNSILGKRKITTVLYTIIIILGAYFSFNYTDVVHNYSSKDEERQKKIYNTNVFKNLSKTLPPDVTHVINVGSFEDVELMFYNPKLIGYHYSLPEEVLEEFAKRKIKLAAFRTWPGHLLAPYTYDYKDLYIIEQDLK